MVCGLIGGAALAIRRGSETPFVHGRVKSPNASPQAIGLNLRVGKLRPAGRMRPSRAFCAAREHFLKLCRFEINTTRGLTRRKSDGVLKKKVIASPLDGKCVRAYNCPQSRIYRLRKGDDLFFFFFFRETTVFAR